MSRPSSLLGAPDLSPPWRAFLKGSAILGLALRAALLVRYAHPTDPELWEFGVAARGLVENGVYSFHVEGVPSAFMPPGYALVIALFYEVFGRSSAGHVALGVLLLLTEIAIPFLAGALARRLWGAAAGRITLLLCLFWPSLLLLSGRFHSVPISISLLLLALAVLWREPWTLVRRGALCGLLLGVYGLFRMELAALLVPFVYGLWREGSRDRSASLSTGRRLAAVALLIAGCVLPVSPWIARNYCAFGRVVLGTSGGYNLLRGHNENATGGGRGLPGHEDEETSEIPARVKALEPDYTHPNDELVADGLFRREALRFAAANPGREVRLLASKTLFFFVADFTHPVQRRPFVWIPSLLALVVGLIWWLRCGPLDPRQQTLWLVFAVNAGLAMIFFVLPRYRIAVEFVPILFFGGWLATLEGVRRRLSRPRPRHHLEGRIDTAGLRL